MTIEEAIKWVDDRMCYGRGKWSKNHPPNFDEYWQAGRFAMEALEKQIPMQVKITASTKRCGRCNRQLSGIKNSHQKKLYCQGCGQKIQWGDKHDK